MKPQTLLDLLQEISLCVAEAQTTPEAQMKTLSKIGRYTDWPIGHVYLQTPAADKLTSSRIWHLADDLELGTFQQLTEDTKLDLGQEGLGRVWATGRLLILTEITDRALLERPLPPIINDLHSYYAFPILVNSKVNAVLEFFSTETEPPDEALVSVIKHACQLLGIQQAQQETLDHLRQREAQLTESQQAAHVGHWHWDILEDKLTWSAELFRIFGLTPHEFQATYEGFLDRVHPNEVDYVHQTVMKAFREGQPFDHVHSIIWPDGSERILHAIGLPEQDQQGNIISLQGTVQDVTRQKQTEQTLTKTLRQYSALMEIAQTIAATLDLQLIYNQVLTLLRPLMRADALILFLYLDEMLEVVAVDDPNHFAGTGLRIPPDVGIAGQVWQNKQTLLLRGEECHQQSSSFLKKQTNYLPEVILAVPIIWRDEIIGVLEATHVRPDAFGENEVQLLEMAATWVAIAIANARQYEQLERRLDESAAILAISDAFTQTLEIDELLQIIVDHVQELVPTAEWTTIHLLNRKQDQLELVAYAGVDVQPDDYRVNIGEGIVGRVIQDGIIVNVADMQTDPRRLPINTNMMTRSMLAAPIQSRQRRRGSLSVQSSAVAKFTAADEHLLTILGVQAGMAIENARLYASQRNAARHAEFQRLRMRRMAQRVVQAQEDERKRIARELHDEAGQSLTSLKISLDMIRMSLPPEMGDASEMLGEVLELADQTMSNLRLLSHNLRPPGLDVYGLDAALTGLCHDIDAHTPLTVHYEGIKLPTLSKLTALSLYRFAQEALTNIVKHAGASEAQVTLQEKDGLIELSVVDNGRGFNPPDMSENVPARGVGLVGMLERLEMVEGRLEIDSVIGHGSCLTAIVPFKEGEE